MIALIIAVPIVGIAVNLATVTYWREPRAGIIASGAAGLSFVVALLQFMQLLANPEPTRLALAEWIRVGSFSVGWTLNVDTLSMTMILLVTGIGTLIHVYSIAYMRSDPRFTRFFIYLNLFLVEMLILITADNFLVLFAGWEGVGLCSFLLIGFWFDKAGEGAQISNAARKAFIVNRIGDAGLLTALLLLATRFGTLDFAPIFAAAPARFNVGAPEITVITLLLFVGASAKSAQIPLHIWLPDAMVGPTPVSALIHAATMVTAGVYLIVRAHVLFDLAPLTQSVIIITGTATSLLMAGVAVSQFDIKRVLAYSTISQLGLMMAAVGIGAYTAAMFHLVSHAFIKALLFLAAGTLLHTLGTQDARQMGGLRKLRIVFATYMIGAFALAGLPPFSGFFSKDEILAAAFERSIIVYVVLSAAAFLTAFYITRQFMLIFTGTARSDTAQHAHESQPILTYPLIALAILAAGGGLLNFPGSLGFARWIGQSTGETQSPDFNLLIAALSSIVALAGIVFAYVRYRRYRVDSPPESRLASGFQRDWRLDTFYNAFIVQPFKRLASRIAAADSTASYGLDRAVVNVANRLSSEAGKLQTGQLSWNIAWVMVGLIVVMLLVIIGRGL